MNKQEMIDKIYEVIVWHKEFDERTIDYYKIIRLWDILWYYPIYAVDGEYEWEINLETVTILNLYKKKSDIVDNQSEECITFIYNLIKDDTN